MNEVSRIQVLVYDAEGSVQKTVNLKYAQLAGIIDEEDNKLVKAELGSCTTAERLLTHKEVSELVDPKKILFDDFVSYVASEAAKKNQEESEEN